MNTLSFLDPRFASNLFDAIDRNFASMNHFPENPKRFSPKVDVKEAKDSYILDMELAGFSEDQVEIELQDRVLSISSKREQPQCTNEKEVTNQETSVEEKAKEFLPKCDKPEFKWLLKERGFRNFSRSFSLPEDIDGENVSANFKNGLLTIRIPKKTETKSRKIAIGA